MSGYWSELRSSGAESGYTDSITATFQTAAEGGDGSNPLRTAVLEAAASVYAACFAAARMDGTQALTPPVRDLVARELMRRGESFRTLNVEAGRLMLRPAGYATV